MEMVSSTCLIWCLWRISSESLIKRITQIAQIKAGNPLIHNSLGILKPTHTHN